MDSKRRDEIVQLLRESGAANDPPPAPAISINTLHLTIKIGPKADLAELLRQLRELAPK